MRARRPQPDEARDAGRRDDDTIGPNIAVRDLGPVQRGERPREGAADGPHPLGRQRPRQGIEAIPSLEAVHDAGRRASLPDTVYAAEARVRHAGERPGAVEERAALVVRSGEQVKDDRPIELPVVREEHGVLRSPEWADDAVLVDQRHRGRAHPANAITPLQRGAAHEGDPFWPATGVAQPRGRFWMALNTAAISSVPCPSSSDRLK